MSDERCHTGTTVSGSLYLSHYGLQVWRPASPWCYLFVELTLFMEMLEHLEVREHGALCFKDLHIARRSSRS
jgi:hypothetical protein